MTALGRRGGTNLLSSRFGVLNVTQDNWSLTVRVPPSHTPVSCCTSASFSLSENWLPPTHTNPDPVHEAGDAALTSLEFTVHSTNK